MTRPGFACPMPRPDSEAVFCLRMQPSGCIGLHIGLLGDFLAGKLRRTRASETKLRRGRAAWGYSKTDKLLTLSIFGGGGLIK